MPTLTIDGQSVAVADGATVLEAARQVGIEIPTLCHHADLAPVGSCRMCLVRVAGHAQPDTACSLIARDDMLVTTSDEQLDSQRRMLLEMLLSRYHDAGYPAGNGATSEFMQLVQRYQARPPATTQPRYDVDSDANPFVFVDLNKCILCTRCVRVCGEVQGRFVWSVADRGDEARVTCGHDVPMLDARCESCGACADFCPTGALDHRMSMSSQAIDRAVPTTCGYCGVGCQLDLQVRDEQIVGVASRPNAPVNGSSLCVKGRYGYDFVHHVDRVLRPRVRQYLLDGIAPSQRPADRGPWVEVSWDTALNVVAKRFADIWQESGADAFGVLSSAKCTNEENYLMQKFARQILKTNNVDHCARLCHSSTVAGLAMAMGSGAMSNSMDDIASHAKAILIIGSNTTEQHPVFGSMLRQAALRGTRIVVADPRQIDMTEFAEIHLRQRPGTDVALLNGIMHLAMANDWMDTGFIESRCESFQDLIEMVAKYTPDLVTEITGVPQDQLVVAARLLCTTHPMAVIWSMGITQHTTGVSNVLSLANLQMLLGNMGMPGGGVNPLRGQNNVQGACDMGALPNVYPGYQRVDDQNVAHKFDDAWRLSDDAKLDLRPGLTVTEIISAADQGRIRALYILGEDPAMTEPDSNHARACLAKTEFVVLQEIFPSETSIFADVLLPGASFAEKHGTFTNTERRVQPIRAAICPLGEARPDWQITSDLAQSILAETDRQPQGPLAGWDYSAAADVLAEINRLTPSYAGITAERIERGERLQWPVPDTEHPGTPILHQHQFTRGLGKFHAVDYLPAAELPDEDYPLLLTTGRVLYHWHGGELTRRASGLSAVCPEPLMELSPDDAIRYGVADGDWLTLQSRRGELRARARITTRVAEGVVFGNFHFPGSGNVNNLTINATDPIARIPEYKVCAVRLRTAG